MNKSQRIGIDLGERKVLADNFFVWPGRSDIPALARRRRVRRASPTRLPVSRPQRPRLRCDVHIAIHRSIVRDDCESVLGRPSWSGVLVTGPFGSAYKRNLSMTLITKAQTEQLLTIGLAPPSTDKTVLVHLRIFVRKKAVIAPMMGFLEISTPTISMT